MKIDQKYLKKILSSLLNYSSPYMRLSALGHEIGLMVGNVHDSVSSRINEEELKKFQGHIAFLSQQGYVTCSDSSLGFRETVNGRVIVFPSVSYQLTPLGRSYTSELNRRFFSKASKSMWKAAGKAAGLFIGALITGLAVWALNHFLGVTK